MDCLEEGKERGLVFGGGNRWIGYFLRRENISFICAVFFGFVMMDIS